MLAFSLNGRVEISFSNLPPLVLMRKKDCEFDEIFLLTENYKGTKKENVI